MAKKIIYKHTGIELGSIHNDLKEMLYTVWGKATDEDLERFGLEAIEEKEEEKK
jgi:hypothetical protein